MLCRATFHTNGLQTLMLQLDGNECTSCLVTRAKRSPLFQRQGSSAAGMAPENSSFEPERCQVRLANRTVYNAGIPGAGPAM